MNDNTSGKKVLSLVLLIAGAAGMIGGLVLAFSGSGNALRGALLILGAVAILLGLYFIPTLEHHRSIINFLFCFPLLFAFAVTVIIPLCLGIFYSTTDWNGVKMTSEVGLANYAAMFNEAGFLWSVLITFLFVIFNMILVNVIGFCLALLCTSRLGGVGFFRAAYFLPNLIGGIVLGYVWQFVFNNVLLSLTSSMFNMRSSILADTPTMLIYINGLVTIPGDVIEAANIDGASPLATLFQIKIPMIMSTITICTFLTLTSAFKQFDVNMALTNGTGSVNFLGNYLTNGTQMLALNIYNTAIAKNSYALGQAKAVLFFIILATVSLIQVRITNSKEVEM